MNVFNLETTKKRGSDTGYLKPPITDTYGRTAEVFLDEYFQYSYCCECGGDTVHHTAILINGNWFARCDFLPPANCVRHPVIDEFRSSTISEENNALLMRFDNRSSGGKIHKRRRLIESRNAVFFHNFWPNQEARFFLGRCA